MEYPMIGKIRKSGNSYVMTIPHYLVKAGVVKKGERYTAVIKQSVLNAVREIFTLKRFFFGF